MQIARGCGYFNRISRRGHRIALGAMTAILLSVPAAALAQAPAVPATDEAEPVPVDTVAQNILRTADQIRFPNEGFQVDISILSKRADQTTETRKYQVLSKGNDRTVVIVTEPAAERGQTMLMSGRDLWVFLPSVSQPVRLSLAQRLTGQVANGDLARANFAGDYNPKLLRAETIDGESYHVLELTAVDRGVTYQRVMYWVGQKNSYPHKAEFYSVSGRLLKTCRYENFQNMAGKVRPTRLVMVDALRAGEQSMLEYNAMKLRDLPDKIFTKDYLKKLD
ncbi:MAG: outer membrane lipoprotein-sorting protein [Rhodocyclaceae bacterium]|nr:outer membrane lipoprotein-sorting protein [Rhodocyclaceae bacterium]